MIVAGQLVKPGYYSSTVYQDQNTLKMIAEAGSDRARQSRPALRPKAATLESVCHLASN
jgi:hypothetical protein